MLRKDTYYKNFPSNTLLRSSLLHSYLHISIQTFSGIPQTMYSNNNKNT